MRGQTGRDGMGWDWTGFFFLSLSFPYSKDGEGRRELVTYALELGRRYREVHDVDKHACQRGCIFSFSKARQNRTEHTHTQ